MDYSTLRETFKRDAWTESQERILLEPFTYLNSVAGKEVRSQLIAAFNLWLNVPEPDLEVIRHIVSMLHNASLLMDDVEDDSELRRGVPVAHMIYGVPQTINTANYVYFLAFQELLQLRESKGQAAAPDLVAMVTEELLNLHRGQGLDLFWRDSLTCPTEEEYVQMVLGKTGGLFRIAVKLMMARSESTIDFVPLVNLISIWFQIRDDYMNLASGTYADNKGFAEDLTEGKFSFPVVHGVRADTTNRQILNVMQKRTTSHALKAHTVDYLAKETKSFEYTRGVLDTLLKQIKDEVAELGGNRALEKIIEALEKTPTEH
ncbi:hypothetical protein CcaverHIS002_0411550 [Cutaneotrichosporon cavernicola]|uniref:(2E,6E)-farnesyl diphosphate synthase n=1 Tax=Cutaneotrichosporon cavernicola TaxID=279322 RepID=A0AA48QWF2_9TREE|nr:uncharacterized protein CcaverHIS019_0411480 [Cutaneotrichosporon cavernicola]BEI84551.1 hypothetical protein CcaverHIS002_0411550 [Cutaneotrichosporon cavernicola]BEI92328.1 hypothetical protein CcaverHIS019_0411480 [Cutaneotrichosporon cavernicola]BEJ00098.1 hypothetical protein CcaverHIS631_0411400 [Cutaneotrichosporon cavernicola]BEJ07869.1 hypothetical protein CcaverHIS641_0411380 [Cutaneotrichosporon cavernicola]